MCPPFLKAVLLDNLIKVSCVMFIWLFLLNQHYHPTNS